MEFFELKVDSPLHDAKGTQVKEFCRNLPTVFCSGEMRPPAASCSGESDLIRSYRCNMQRGAKYYCYIMQRGIKSYYRKMQRGVKGKIPGNIYLLHDAAVRFNSPLHDAAESQILPPQDAVGSQILTPHDTAGSQFGSGESSLKTLEDSLDP